MITADTWTCGVAFLPRSLVIRALPPCSCCCSLESLYDFLCTQGTRGFFIAASVFYTGRSARRRWPSVRWPHSAGAVRLLNLTAINDLKPCTTAPVLHKRAERGHNQRASLSPAHVPSRTRRGASAHSCDALVDHRGDKSPVSIDQHQGSATATSNGDAKRCILIGARRRPGNCFSWWIAARGLCDRGTDRWLSSGCDFTSAWAACCGPGTRGGATRSLARSS